METISIKIDDRDIETLEGATILEAALENKIYIPHLCYHPDLKPAGSCRICLVELDDGKLVTSCRTPVKEGMIVRTKGTEIDKVRGPVIEMILANHHMDCKPCPKKGHCELQKITAYMKTDRKGVHQRLRLPKEELPIDGSNPFFIRDHNKCVLCGICVRTCHEIAGVNAIDFAGRGNNTKIATFGDKPIAESRCVSCGECVIRCPVGALVPGKLQRPATEVKTICPYCGCGCGLYIGIRDNRIVNVRGDAENPVNKGRLCVKGRFGMDFVHSPDRLTGPLIKSAECGVRSAELKTQKTESKKRPSSFREASWDEAIDFVARKLKKYQGEEFALIASTKCTNEDNYIAQKFARVAMGSNNIDTTARLGYGPTLAAFCSIGSCVGFDPRIQDGDMPYDMLQRNIEGVGQAACILVAGADITRTHPVLGMKIKKAVENGAKLLVISPFENDLCRIAEKRLQPYPGTEPALIMGMCNVIAEQALFDDTFIELYCKNYEEFKASLDDFSIGRVERITGVSRDLIEEAARIYAGGKPAAIFWGKGITQSSHGTDNVYALINLAILTSNIKYPFALNPLTDQNNALGACDMGCLPDYYPGYQPIASEDAREKFNSLWGGSLNPAPGLTLTEILDAVLEGKIKALYIIGSDPATSIAPSKKARAALKKAKFIVFQDIFLNETAKYADVVLPAACFAEKEGTFADMDGKIQRVQKALDPSGHSRPDWEILCDLARGMKCKGFEYGGAGDILDEVSSIVQGIIERTDRFSLFPLQYKPPAETTDIDYPLALTIERDIYDGGVLSEKAEGLMMLRTKGLVYINPKDAADFEIGDGEMIRVVSRHGSCEGKALLTGATPAGLAVMDIDGEKTNNLLDPVLDDVSKTPDMKICAVRIEKQKAAKKKQKSGSVRTE